MRDLMLRVCLGLFWIPAFAGMTAGDVWAACTRPDGVEGEIVYIKNTRLVQYCDGENWIGVGWKRAPMRAAGTSAGQIQFRGSEGLLAASSRFLFDGSGLVVSGAPGGGHTTVNAGSLEIYRAEATSSNVKGFIDFKSVPDRDYEMRIWYEDSKALRIANDASDGIGDWVALMSVMRTGEVGIGVSAPAAKLDVMGKIRVSHGPASKYFELASLQAGAGSSCDAVCGVKYCLGAYWDNLGNDKIDCANTTNNRTCMCVGR